MRISILSEWRIGVCIGCVFILIGLTFGWFVHEWRLHKLETMQRISVGMTERDVYLQLGKPWRVFEKNDRIEPSTIGECAPDIDGHFRVLLYYMHFNVFVFIQINESGRVSVIYRCES